MLRVSDLMASDVLTADGRRIGRVHEIRAVQDGPLRQGTQAAIRVDALLVGRGTVGGRLGYHHGQVTRPWLLRVIFQRTHRHVREIAAGDIAEWDDERRVITLRPGAGS